MKQKVLVLGGGAGQSALLRRLRDRQIHIVLQDRNPGCSGRMFAGDFVEADTCDAAAAASAACAYQVDGVLTAGTDQPVLAASIAAEARGCPSLHTPGTARRVTDKETMKTALSNAGIPVPEFQITDSRGISGNRDLSWSNIRFPAVVKPVDSQGQRGVIRIETADEFDAARDAALAYSRRGKVILETYCPHKEVTVSGWVHQGRLKVWAVTDRVTRDFLPHIGLCYAHRYPSLYARGRESEISDISHRCCAALGIEEGPAYFQFLVTERGILVNECASRLGGAYEDISLPPVCGNTPLDLLIDGTLEGRADPDDSRFTCPITAGAFAVPLVFCRPGRIAGMSSARQILGIPGVTDFAYLLENGTVINPPRNSVQRAAYMVVHGKDIREVNRVLKTAIPRMSISDDQGRQLLRNPLGYAINEY